MQTAGTNLTWSGLEVLVRQLCHDPAREVLTSAGCRILRITDRRLTNDPHAVVAAYRGDAGQPRRQP